MQTFKITKVLILLVTSSMILSTSSNSIDASESGVDNTTEKTYVSVQEGKFMMMFEKVMKNPKTSYSICLRSKVNLPYKSMENMETLKGLKMKMEPFVVEMMYKDALHVEFGCKYNELIFPILGVMAGIIIGLILYPICQHCCIPTNAKLQCCIQC